MKELGLTQGKVALVDDDLFEFLNQWKWHTHKHGKTFYVARRIKEKRHWIHQYIIGSPLYGFEIDHRDGNGLNNLRDNLRIITHRQNTQNKKNIKKSSVYPGVSWYKPTNKWLSHIVIKGKAKHLGHFPTELEAFNAYQQACERIGEPCLST